MSISILLFIAGVLFSFEPPFEEHQGKRLRRYLVSCARKYRQMLESLLHEVNRTDTTITLKHSLTKDRYVVFQVPVQPSEWHRTLLIPQAWSLFMVRAYEACLEVCDLYSSGATAQIVKVVQNGCLSVKINKRIENCHCTGLVLLTFRHWYKKGRCRKLVFNVSLLCVWFFCFIVGPKSRVRHAVQSWPYPGRWRTENQTNEFVALVIQNVMITTKTQNLC